MRSEPGLSFVEKPRGVELRQHLGRLGWLDAKCERNILQRREIAVIGRCNAHHIEPCAEQRIRKQLKLRVVDRLVICAPPVVHSIPNACMYVSRMVSASARSLASCLRRRMIVRSALTS